MTKVMLVVINTIALRSVEVITAMGADCPGSSPGLPDMMARNCKITASN